MSPFLREIKYVFANSKAYNRLIMFNVVVFIILQLAKLTLFLLNVNPMYFNTLIRELSVPAYFDELIFKPWTLLTYMFLHEDPMHLLFNMLFLYWFGQIYEEYVGKNKLIYTYLAGGFSGAALFILAFNVFPVFAEMHPSPTALGASAGIMAIVIATATLMPNYSMNLILFGPVSLKIIAVFFVGLDILNISRENPGGHIAHLGGAILGFVFIRQLKKGNNPSEGFEKLAKKFNRIFQKKREKVKVVYSRKPLSDEEYNSNKKHKQEMVDEILDKIAESGYDSLTKKEKETLFKISKEDL